MRDAFGGIVNINMIVIFIVLVSGYLAFNVTYTKAFHMKNKIITTIEQYRGNCNQDCQKIISDYADDIGFNVSSNGTNTLKTMNVDTSFADKDSDFKDSKNMGGNPERGYAWVKVDANTTSSNGIQDNRKVYYKVGTKIAIDIPIIRELMDMFPVFTLTGSTKLLDEQ